MTHLAFCFLSETSMTPVSDNCNLFLQFVIIITKLGESYKTYNEDAMSANDLLVGDIKVLSILNK